MMYSECCSELVYDDHDICSECLEHCESYYDGDDDDEMMEKLLEMNPEFDPKNK